MCDTGLVQLRGVYRSAHLEVVVVEWCMKKDTLYSCVVVGGGKFFFLCATLSGLERFHG